MRMSAQGVALAEIVEADFGDLLPDAPADIGIGVAFSGLMKAK